MAIFGTAQFYNFTASARKLLMVAMGMMPASEDLGWIYGPGNGQVVVPSGTVDGQNNVFTLPVAPGNGLSLAVNGIVQDPAKMYSLSGATITSNYPYIPSAGSYLSAIIF